jgi:ankyrin repeat protein
MAGNEGAVAALLASGGGAPPPPPPARVRTSSACACCWRAAEAPTPAPPPVSQADSVTADGWTLLHLASSAGSCATMEVLLRDGADVRAVTLDPPQWTALHFAAFAGASDAVRLLLGADAPPGALSGPGEGRTPLHLACLCESPGDGGARAAAALLDVSWAELNWEDEDGATALHLAAEAGRVDCVRLLVQRGANAAAIRRSDGQTAAQCTRDPAVRAALVKSTKL